jgi:hypothetical protein
MGRRPKGEWMRKRRADGREGNEGKRRADRRAVDEGKRRGE